MNFNEIIKSAAITAVVGTCKNAGKTTVLNNLIKAAEFENIRFGITSIGIDGEEKDSILNTHKPPVYAPRGCIIATTEAFINSTSISLEILDVLNMNTSIGRVILAMALEDGFIKIAGPNTNSEMREVCSLIRDIGCSHVFIDGALSRKTQASPSIADGIILATGAAISRNMSAVIRETQYTISLLSLKKVNSEIMYVYKEALKSNVICFIDDNYEIMRTGYKTACTNGEKVMDHLPDYISEITVPGALPGSFIKACSKILRDRKIKIVINDGTRVFADSKTYDEFIRLGGEIEVLNSINVHGVTVNPVSPLGWTFDPELFLKSMREGLYPIDVYDCFQGGF